MIAAGPRSSHLYTLQSAVPHAFISNRCQITTHKIWHQRLGHPHLRIVDFLKANRLIRSFNNTDAGGEVCGSCQMSKSCRLPFLPSATFINEPLIKFHCDLWGPAPILSCQRYHYYVIFVDECTRFTWLFPLRRKSDFLHCLKEFYQFISAQFEKRIKVFQTDGGGEFTGKEISSFFSTHGILHQLSCPHTPEQNGLVERKHRNATELGLTMLFHSNVPKRFWVEAFASAIRLINRLPTRTLHMHSPFDKLFVISHYTLRVFGCRCFPYLRDYAKIKFDPRSLPCVFMGYSQHIS